MLRPSVAAAFAFLALTGTAAAQPAVGSEFLVNSYTTGSQYNAAVAADPDGDFVIVWNSDGQDGHSLGIFGQRFDRLGTPFGTEFAINTFTIGYQVDAAVAMHSSGDFLVVWTSGGVQDGSSVGVFARHYGSGGTIPGGEFQVNTYTYDDQHDADVASQPSGEFVAVWQSYSADGYGLGIFGQRIDAFGERLGAEFQVNSYTTGRQLRTAVAASAAGFVVVWSSIHQDGNGYGVFAQRFDTSGGMVGPEFLVNTHTVDLQDDADVAADAAGNFVVVWHSFGQDGHSYGIFGQRFDAAGNRLGSEFQVNSYTTARQWRPSVMREPGGAFIVAWTSTNEIGQSDDVFAQQFEANGTRLGPEFRVNTYATGIQEIPALAFLGEEKFLVAWSSFGQDGDRFGVYAQRYGDFLFRDGFEGGP